MISLIAIADGYEINGYQIYQLDELGENNSFSQFDTEAVTTIEIDESYNRKLLKTISDKELIRKFISVLSVQQKEDVLRVNQRIT